MLRLHPEDDRDEGFSLIEVVVALVLLGAIAASSAVFFTRATVATSEQQRRQDATALVESALDAARSVAPTALLSGRTQAAVNSQWTASQASDKSTTIMAWDTAAAPAASVAVPLTTTSVVSNETYTVNTLIGVCYRTNDEVSASACTSRGLGPTSPVPADALKLYRVIVEVGWQPGGLERTCGGVCVVRSSTIVDPSEDTRWSVLSAPTAFSSIETFDARGSSATQALRTLVDAGNTDATSKVVVSSVDAGSAFLVDNSAYSSTNTTGGGLSYQIPANTAGPFKARYFVRNSDGQVSRTVTKTVALRPVVANDSASIVLRNLLTPTTPTLIAVRNNDIPATGNLVVIADLTRTNGTCTATATSDGQVSVVKGSNTVDTCKWTYTLRSSADSTIVSSTAAVLTVTVAA